MPGSDEVNAALKQWVDRRIASLIVLAQHYSAKMEGEAKLDPPWEDRTGHARQGLFGQAVIGDGFVVATINHTQDYGVYLELANSGKYAILEPTVKNNASDWVRDVALIMAGGPPG